MNAGRSWCIRHTERVRGLDRDYAGEATSSALSHCALRCGDSDHIDILGIHRALNAISWGKEGVETLNEGRVTCEQSRNTFDDAGGVDPMYSKSFIDVGPHKE